MSDDGQQEHEKKKGKEKKKREFGKTYLIVRNLLVFFCFDVCRSGLFHRN